MKREKGGTRNLEQSKLQTEAAKPKKNIRGGRLSGSRVYNGRQKKEKLGCTPKEEKG